MWFAIHVKPGTESQAVDLLNSTADKAGLQELFCPRSVIVSSDGEKLVEDELPLIPGTVFAIAPSKWQLRSCLRKADGMEYLYNATPCFDALNEDEIDFIESLAEPGERTVQMSEGVVDAAGYVRVHAGPLLGREQRVRKYGSKKRRAFLNTSIAGVPATAQVGLRITRNDNVKHWDQAIL